MAERRTLETLRRARRRVRPPAGRDDPGVPQLVVVAACRRLPQAPAGRAGQPQPGPARHRRVDGAGPAAAARPGLPARPGRRHVRGRRRAAVVVRRRHRRDRADQDRRCPPYRPLRGGDPRAVPPGRFRSRRSRAAPPGGGADAPAGRTDPRGRAAARRAPARPDVPPGVPRPVDLRCRRHADERPRARDRGRRSDALSGRPPGQRGGVSPAPSGYCGMLSCRKPGRHAPASVARTEPSTCRVWSGSIISSTDRRSAEIAGAIASRR